VKPQNYVLATFTPAVSDLSCGSAHVVWKQNTPLLSTAFAGLNSITGVWSIHITTESFIIVN
jgi:hypothetical protein